MEKKRTRGLWPALSVLLLGLMFVMPWSAKAQTPELTDVNVSSVVTTALANDQAVEGVNLDVLTQEGIVTLAGTVNNPLAKERAVKLAKTIKGVRGIVNRIEVVPPEKPDSLIKTNIQNALAWDPAAESYEITVDASDGVVTLQGSVESWQERELAGRIAKGISGVKEVNNQVEVDYTEERSDDEIKQDIQDALLWNRYVDDSLIRVNVSNGMVSLTGVVGSAAEKEEARLLSWIVGVDAVDTSGLTVESWAREERFRQDKYMVKEDEAIEQAVHDALFYDPRVRMFEINVSSDGGVLTLGGTVDNLKAKRSAAQTARNIVGVWRVKNQIKVKPGTPTDTAIKKRIQNVLKDHPYTEKAQIGVAVNNGKVTLSGTVDTYFEKAQADDVASRIYGVVAVRNLLQVDDRYNIFVNNPYVNTEWFVYDYPWYTYPTYQPVLLDAEIREDIKAELFWSPFVDADQVNVAVDDAMATLTGKVNTWSEYWAAQENAYEGGAVWVNNELDIGYGPDYLF